MTLTYCPLFSGSSGNAAVIKSQSSGILIDAGLSGSRIAEALRQTGTPPEALKAIVITHEHSDHIKGAGILARRYNIPIYANAGTWQAMSGMLGKLPDSCIRVFETCNDFYIGDINVFPYPVSHDAAQPVGFTFTCGGRSVGQMTDLGVFSGKCIDYVKRCDLLLIESNHDVFMLKNGRYPASLKQRILGTRGHLSNDAAGLACCELAEAGVKRFILGHLSGENNTERIAFDTVTSTLKESGARLPAVFMAHRDRPCGVFTL